MTVSASSREQGSKRSFVEELHDSMVDSESKSSEGEGEAFRELFVHEEDVEKRLLW